jgi:hypothetical protein
VLLGRDRKKWCDQLPNGAELISDEEVETICAILQEFIKRGERARRGQRPVLLRVGAAF